MKLQGMQENKKVWPHTEKIYIVSVEAYIDLLDKDFKSAILSMFKEGKTLLIEVKNKM